MIGAIVEITVDRGESGDLGKFNKIAGRIRGRIKDREGVSYTVIESWSVSEATRESSPPRESVTYFLVAPRAIDETLESAAKPARRGLPVGIGRVLDESILDSPVFDQRQVEYIAVGHLTFVDADAQHLRPPARDCFK